MFKFCCVSLLLRVVVVGLNVTENNTARDRKGRFLTFDQDDDGVKISLSLEVPFITVPVKQAVDAASKAKSAIANVNVGALAFAGAVTFAATFLLPAVLSFLSKKFLGPPSYRIVPEQDKCNMTSRDIPSEPSELWQRLTTIDDLLKEKGVDMTSCLQRILCWEIRKSSNNVRNNLASSRDKILEGFATNEWLRTFLKNTPLDSAVESGLGDLNCSVSFKNCVISQWNINMFFKNIVRLINGL